MSNLIFLGSSNAIPTANHQTTQFALITPGRKLLVDCGTNPVVRLEQAGIEVNDITDIILTHFHPDHVAALPLLLLDMWLMKRRTPLYIHGLDYTIERVESMMALFDWEVWPDFYPVNFNRVGMDNMTPVLEDDQMRILSSPVNHFLPTICLRIELKLENKSIAYSCDTEPCQAVLDISKNVDILLHEASGNFEGHSSATQAGEVARDVGAGALYLVHYPTGRFAKGDLEAEARSVFNGKVRLAVDLLNIELKK
ncbi:MAG TPA: MBL fold metallo-hydrolase [Anaerolineales bacterium]|jgi:ribonuclease Z